MTTTTTLSWPRFALLFACGLALFASTCGAPPVTTLSGAGVTVRRVQGNERAARQDGLVATPGDFVLEGDGVRLVVGGLGREQAARGAILEAGLVDAPVEDGIVLFAPSVVVADQAVPITVADIYPVMRHGRPAIHVDASFTLGVPIAFQTELAIARGGRAIYVQSRVVPLARAHLGRVQLGARVAWGGAEPFVPGQGGPGDGWHETPWVGVEGATSSMALGFFEDRARIRAAYEHHGETRFLQYTEVLGAERSLEGTAPLVTRLALGLAHGSLAEAVRRLGWAFGRPFPEVVFNLPYAPAGAIVEVKTLAGEPVLRARADPAGRAIVPIVASDAVTAGGTLQAFATAYGHADADAVTFRVAPNARVRLDIPRGGHIRIRAVDAATGEPMLARARILGVSGTPSPLLGPDFAAHGAGDSVVLMSAETELVVRPGRYRVLVSHGPEWTLHDETVLVTPTYRPDVSAQLEHVVDPGEWVGCDFHVHAAPSPDSKVTLEDRVDSLAAEGVRFAVPTDHNHVTDYASAVAALHVPDFGTTPGVEVTTADPAFGHFNAYPFPLDPAQLNNGAPAFLGTTPSALFRALHAAGQDVIVQVNHPRLEGGIGYFDLMGYDPASDAATGPYDPGFDALEVWNGFDLARAPAFERVLRDWMELLDHDHRIVATGNSDSHQVRYQWAGYPRTYVRVPGGRIDDPHTLVEALRQGRAFVTSGPFLTATIDAQGPGEVVVAHGGVVHVHVIVRAPPWIDVSSIELWSQSALVKTAEIARPAAPHGHGSRHPTAPPPPPLVRFDGILDLEVGHDTYVVALTKGTQTPDDYFGRSGIVPLAFTNPIWVDVDGDGQVVLTAPSAPHDLPPADQAAPLSPSGGDGASLGDGDAALGVAPGSDAGPPANVDASE